MTKAIFITGTDTEIGKTFVSKLIVKDLVAQGHRVAVMKPVASGAQMQDGQLRNDDALQLIEESNVDCPYDLVNPYCFKPAIAPHIAAEQAGLRIRLDIIKDAFDQLALQSDVVVVEGVGGWSVPINEDEAVSDLAYLLNIPVLLVVGMRLGCINHALLTADAIRSNNNKLIGWIANNIDPNMQVNEQNIHSIQSRIKTPLLASIPYIKKGVSDQTLSFDLSLLHE